MNHRLLYLGLLATAHAIPARAADRANVERLLAATHMARVSQQIIPEVDRQFDAGMQSMLNGRTLTTDERQRMDRFIAATRLRMHGLLAWEKLEPTYIQLYMETFSNAEVDALTRFYETPEGRSVMEKMPLVARRTMQALQPMLNNMMEGMQADAQRILASPAPPAPPAPPVPPAPPAPR